MRHKNAGRKFDRNTSSRRAMFRNLTANLVLNERIETTDAKAKELRRVAERLITKAIRLGEVVLHAAREALRGRQGQAPRDEAAHLGVPSPLGNARREGRRDEEGRPRREGPARPRQALRQAPRRLHAHHQDRPAPWRQRPARLHRVRRPGRCAGEGEEGEKKAKKKAAPKKAAASKKTEKAAAAAG